VLGERGLRVCEELAEKEWAKVPPLKPGDSEMESYHDRFCITHMMEKLADLSGNVDRMVEIRARDLSSPYAFLEIAEICKKAVRSEEALEWALKGITAFRHRPDERLYDFAAQEYHQRGEHDKGVELSWDAFLGGPNLERYQALKKSAEAGGQWPMWRQKSLDHLHGMLQARELHHFGAASEMVRIFLWEGDLENAWKIARDHDCGNHVWLELASKSEAKRPKDSMEIYKSEVESVLQCSTSNRDERALELIRKIGRLACAANHSAEYAEFLSGLLQRHKRKTKFMKLMDQSGVR